MTAKKFKVIYFGTSEFAVAPLEYLAKKHDIVAVVTQPDRPSGRKMELQASPVKQKALELSLPILQPEKIRRNKEFHLLIQNLEHDFSIVVSYGQIIPKEILDAPKYMPINIHGSILPSYRGASPIQQTLLNGDDETGVTFIEMDEGVDTGGILFIKKLKVDLEDNLPTLSYKLSHIGGLLLPDLLDDIASGTTIPIPQDDSKASKCKKIEKKDGQINWEKQTAKEIHNKLRAFTPWPGIYTFMNDKRVKILDTKSTEDKRLEPGQTHIMDKKNFCVGCKNSSLEILKLQPEGKKAMTSEEFLRGQQKEFKFSSE